MTLFRTVLPIVASVAITYGLLCAWVYATQRSQIYFPTPESQNPDAQVQWLQSQGERIKLWAVPRPGPGALIYFGGNAEDVAGNIESFAAAFPDRSLFLVNYRGYGGSSGQPSEAGLRTDALAIFDHVSRDHSDVAVMGRSLGSAVAVQVASQRTVSRLVLVTAFDSLVNVAKHYVRWLPVGLLLRDRYDSASVAHEVRAPVLLVVAERDEIIPRARPEKLASALAPGQVEVVVVPGVGHNTLDLSPEYLEAVRGFLAATANDGERH
jgi:pimeloyl-ACP methyl ester carboxylesterase